MNIKGPQSPLSSHPNMSSHNPIQLAAIANYKLAQLTFAPPDLHSLRKTAVIKNMLEDVYTSTPAEWLSQMTRWQYFTPESLEEMTQEGLEEIFQQYAQTIEAFRPVRSQHHYGDNIFVEDEDDEDEDDGQGDDLWIADEEELPLPPTTLPSQLLLSQEQETEHDKKTNSVGSSTSSIFSQPNTTIISNELVNSSNGISLAEKPLPANPVLSHEAQVKQARRNSGFGGSKNRLSWTSDTGITSSVVSQNLANEIMSLFDMDFAIDIKIDTAPKLPELPFKPRRRSQQRQSQDMLSSLIPAFDRIALENSREALVYQQQQQQQSRAKPNIVIQSVPQRSSSLRHRQELMLDGVKSPISPPATPVESPTVEKTIPKKKSLLRLASLVTGKKASHHQQKDSIPHSPEPSPTHHQPSTVSVNKNGSTTSVVNTPRKTSTSTIDSTTSSSSSSSWSYLSADNSEIAIATEKPLPETPTAKNDGRSRRSIKTRRKKSSAVVAKRKSTNGLQSLYDESYHGEKGLSRSKSAFIKFGSGLKNKKQQKQIRRTSSAKNFTETMPSLLDASPAQQSNFQYHTATLSMAENNYQNSAPFCHQDVSQQQQSFVKRMASFNWRAKPRNKPVEA